MNLNRFGREFYVQEITTAPEVTSWDASFDDGETWTTGEAVDGETDQWRWLVRGPDFDEDAHPPADSALVDPTGELLEPLLRATDNPEVVVTRGTPIRLTR